ncbi:hypothetical protein AMECASPLE_035873 [Ameca splendens]|uniref:Uncharacterized protein n=1 Tax=Ameca splendens TaxID=208324 RepID=A0ABV1A5Y9_9TELE
MKQAPAHCFTIEACFEASVLEVTSLRIIFSVGCIKVSSLLSLPVNELGSPSTVLPSKIIHLVPPPPQVQVKQNYLDLSLLLPTGGSPNHLCKQKYIKIYNPEYYLLFTIDPFAIQGLVPVSTANKIFFINLKTFPDCISACGPKQLEKR